MGETDSSVEAIGVRRDLPISVADTPGGQVYQRFLSDLDPDRAYRIMNADGTRVEDRGFLYGSEIDPTRLESGQYIEPTAGEQA